MSSHLRELSRDVQRLCTAACMVVRTDRRRGYVVFEGPTDHMVFGRVMRLEPGWHDWSGDKQMVYDVVRQARTQLRRRAVLGIVDADFDHLGGGIADEDVVRTPDHDLESLLIRSSALELTLRGFNMLGPADPVRDGLMRACLPIGHFLHMSIANRWYLSFKDLVYQDFMDVAKLETSVPDLVDHVTESGPPIPVPQSTIARQIEAGCRLPRSPWKVCRGHDMTSVLALHLSSRGLGDATREVVEARLRGDYAPSDFHGGDMCQQVGSWQAGTQRRVVQCGSGCQTCASTPGPADD